MRPGIAAPGLHAGAEAAIVALARAGNLQAFEELVRRRQSAVRGLLRRMCRDAALADDLAQETLLQAWRQLRSLQSVGAFGGWLRQIAVNVWLQHARRRESFSGANDDLADTPTVAERLDLDGALAQLPAAMRLCIVLNYHEGMSHSEIAAATQLPLGTVKSHIARGTTRLRELLSAYDSTAARSVHAR